MPKLRKASPAALSHPGAIPDSDRAQRAPLEARLDTNQELNPGDRVEGLGNFGKPNGEIGTVERTNDEDAVVKWDDDGRTRSHQPELKRSSPAGRLIPRYPVVAEMGATIRLSRSLFLPEILGQLL